MRRYQPSLLGGLFIGILSALPLVGAANLCCCLWVVSGGALTVYLQQQGRADGPDAAEAMLGGLASGFMGAIIYIAISAVIFSASGELIQAQINTMIDQYPEMPADVRERMLALSSGGSMLTIVTLVTLPLFAVFSMLGALLGMALFRKPKPPAPAAI